MAGICASILGELAYKLPPHRLIVLRTRMIIARTQHGIERRHWRRLRAPVRRGGMQAHPHGQEAGSSPRHQGRDCTEVPGDQDALPDARCVRAGVGGESHQGKVITLLILPVPSYAHRMAFATCCSPISLCAPAHCSSVALACRQLRTSQKYLWPLTQIHTTLGQADAACRVRGYRGAHQ